MHSFDFLRRRNSDNHILKFFAKEIGEEDVPTFLGDKNDLSPRKDLVGFYIMFALDLRDLSRINFFFVFQDKTLDRRFWKQLSKRRRSSSVSDISVN